ncbi:hypothetical protein GCM10027569_92360 [Flindersiella endophytica]
MGRYETYERFEVRPTRRGYGVFDSLMEGFAREDLWVESATREVEWSNKGQLKARPPRPVEIWIDGEWLPGNLTAWSLMRDHETWKGRAVIDGDTRPHWYPPDRLRPSGSR